MIPGVGKFKESDIPAILLCSAIGIATMGIMGVFFGTSIGAEMVRKDAVRNGHAVYYKGVRFDWLPPCAKGVEEKP